MYKLRALIVISIATLCIAGVFAQDEPIRLNNFVVQLADVDLTAAGEVPAGVTVRMDEPGWLFISLSGRGPATVTLSSGENEAVVLEAPGETMRHVEAGQIDVAITRGDGAELERLTIRRVPELMMYMYEGETDPQWQGAYHHCWDELEGAILHSTNLVVSHDREEFVPYAEAWQERGGRWIINQGMRALHDETVDLAHYWADLLGGKVWDGSIHDEVLSRDVEQFPRYADGLARFAAMPASEGKTVYLYCGGTAAIGDPTLLDFFESTDETAAEGARSIRCVAQDESVITARQMSVKLEPGVEYTISAYMRTEDCAPAKYSGLFIIDEGWYSLYGRLRPPEGDSDWTRYEATFTPRESKNGLYQVLMVGPASGSVWIDAVQIERGREATEFTTGEPNILANPGFEDGLALWLRGADEENPLRDAVIEHCAAFAPEIYIHEQATEEKAQSLIERRLVDLPASWSRHYPGVTPKTLVVLSIGDCALRYSNDQFPNVNYKVLLDMQMHALATGKGPSDLRGVGFWSAHYGSPEAVRWYGALWRHYCIEGGTERLTDDPYLLDHIANPGFEEGLEGWETQGLVEAAAVASMLDGGRRGRYASVPEGAGVIRTVRAEGGAANSFGQTIRNLEPERAYAVKFYCTDPAYSDRLIPAEVTIEGGEVLTDYTWDRIWQVNDVRWTMHRRVFRATGTEGHLTIADVDPGEVYWDFVEVEPFYEKRG